MLTYEQMREAAVLLDVALRMEPRLSYFGLGVYGEDSRRRWPEDDATGDALFAKKRAELSKHPDEIAASAEWIRRRGTRATINKLHTSYGYKHAVENWWRDEGSGVYVSNGSFIAAALGLGLDGDVASAGSPNMVFNIASGNAKRKLISARPWSWARAGVARLWLESDGWTVRDRRCHRGRASIPTPGTNPTTEIGLYDLHDVACAEDVDTDEIVRRIRAWSGRVDDAGLERTSERAT